MLSLNNQLYVSIFVEDVELPISLAALVELSTIENPGVFVPTFKLVFRDPSGMILNKYPIGDGCKLAIQFGWSVNDQPMSKSIIYRQFGMPSTHIDGTTNVVTLVGYLDNPRYMRSINGDSFKGTSNGALSYIAKKLGLTFEGDSSSDTMTWITSNRSYARWAAEIASAGWANENSCFCLGVTEDSQLLYKDLSKVAKAAPTASIFYGSQQGATSPAYEALSTRYTSSSGFLNHYLGYGHTLAQEGLDGTSNEYDKVNLTKFGKIVDVNPDVMSSVQEVKRTLMPFDCGNTHPNYAQALHQNGRIKAFLSNSVDCLLDTMSTIKLFDPIDLNLVDNSTRQTNTARQGSYTCTARTRIIRDSKYFELIRCTTTGRQTDALEIGS